MSVHPYLVLTGTTREAMTRYHEILGGELNILGFDDLPADEEAPPFDVPDGAVMHAALMFGDGDLIMASDDPTGDGGRMSGFAVNLTLTDQDEARRVFAELADGGEVQMPLEPTFWAPLFGSCWDRFGVSWMVNVEPAAEEAS
ncbi:VOC family protein [Ilumatobacter sp.]|uniref:VOC family protein n=1 Tax=Ilumatobacter sp. TaxID=1967498 RepID=UPI003B51E0A2